MDDKKLEQLLSDIYGEEKLPSDTLVRRTIEASVRPGHLDKLIGLAVLLNLAVFIGLILLVVFSGYGLITKGLLLLLFSSVLDVLALLIVANKEKLVVFFNQSCFLDGSSKTQGGLL